LRIPAYPPHFLGNMSGTFEGSGDVPSLQVT
jgi:hypothetical protein